MPSLPAPDRVVRRQLADGTVKEYRYPRRRAAKADRYAADSVAALVIAYKQSPEWTAKKPSTQANYRVYLRNLEEMAHTRVADLRRAHLLAVRDATAAISGHGAANVFMAVAGTVLKWAVRRGWIEHSPAAGAEALPGGELRAWTAAQADLAIEKLPEALRRVVLLARYTTQRRGDLCALTWAAYDGQKIRLTQQKRKPGAKPMDLVIPVHPVLRAELDRWKKTATSTHILTTPRGLPWRPMLLTQSLPPALVAIGLPPLGVHGLRKLGATELAQAGCSTHEIAAITGHTTLAMVQHYTKSVQQEHLAEAAITRLKNATAKRRKNAV